MFAQVLTLHTAWNFPIVRVRSNIEGAVVGIGWFLGGTAGLGTVIFAFGIGPSVAAALYFAERVFPNTNSRR